jgi:transcriptional regulator GlxA family with amidase domain
MRSAIIILEKYMALKTAFLIFNKVAELDFAGPWEVFGASACINRNGDTFFTVAETDEPVVGQSGLKIIPEYTFTNMPEADIIIVPGLVDPMPITQNENIMNWIKEMSAKTKWNVGVCTGSVLIAAAGVAKGKRISSHWTAIETLEGFADLTVVRNVRYVRDGNLVTSAGVTAGIDMAIWLMGQIYGVQHARDIMRLLEYYPAPPYAADV